MTEQELLNTFFDKPSFFKKIRKCHELGAYRFHPKQGLQRDIGFGDTFWKSGIDATWGKFYNEILEKTKKEKNHFLILKRENNLKNYDWSKIISIQSKLKAWRKINENN